MKARIKKPLLLLVFAVLLTFVSCEKDLSDDSVKPSNSTLTYRIPLADIPDIAATIQAKQSVASSNTARLGALKEAIFDEEDVMVAKDTVGNVNYSISFFYPDTPENIFYNLVISTPAKGERAAYIVKYKCDLSYYKTFEASGFDYNHFNGEAEIHRYETFFDENTLFYRDGEDEDDCPPIVIAHAGTNAGGYNGPVNTHPSAGFNTVILGYNAYPGTYGWAYGYSGATYGLGGGGGGGHWVWDYLFNIRVYEHLARPAGTAYRSGEEEDCEEEPPVGNVGINISLQTLKGLSMELGLTREQIIFLRGKTELIAELGELLEEDSSVENEIFIKEIIDRMREDPEFTSIKPFLIEKEIDDSQMNPCAQQILAQIKDLTQNDFAKIIAKLGDEASAYKVTIIPDPLDEDTYGEANWSSPPIVPVKKSYFYTIKLNENLLENGTKLAIAGTILHELAHAYFLALYDDYIFNHDFTINNFPYLWNHYVSHPSLSGGTLAQHNQMANSYVDAIARALQEYDTGNAVSENNEPLQVYKDLAWTGLQNTIPYNALSQDDKDRIQNVRYTEYSNSPHISNGITYTPLNTPCN